MLALARPAARSSLGRRVSRRHAHGRRPRRPAAPQARAARSDPHAPRLGLQGRRAVNSLRGAAVRGDSRRARPDPRADDRHRGGADPPAGRPHAGGGARATRRRPRAAAAAQPELHQPEPGVGKRHGSSSSPARARPYVLDVNRSSDGRRPTRASATSTRTARSRRAGCCCFAPRARARPRGTRSCATCCSRARRRGARGSAVVPDRPLDHASDPPCRGCDPRVRAGEPHEPLPEGGRGGGVARTGVQRDGRAALCLPRGRAQLPALGQSRAEDAADRDPRLCGRARRRRIRRRGGGADDPPRGGAARAARS